LSRVRTSIPTRRSSDLRVRIPDGARVDSRERAVLTDQELAVYLAWEHPDPYERGAVLERQTMACVSRMFGGVRLGDLRAIRWEADRKSTRLNSSHVKIS